MMGLPGVTDAGFRRATGTLSADAGIFDTTAAGLARLKPAKPNGTVTFGSQTHPADGNAGAIVTTRQRARALSAHPEIEIELLGFGTTRVENGYMPMAPVPASSAALATAGLDITTKSAPFAYHMAFLLL
jgi:acetyl-CoA acetyltransferase